MLLFPFFISQRLLNEQGVSVAENRDLEGNAVQCMVVVENHAVVCCGGDLFKAELVRAKELLLTKMYTIGVRIKMLCCLSSFEMLCYCENDEFCVVDLRKKSIVESFKLPSSDAVFCLKELSVYGKQSVWIGSKDEIFVFERKKGITRKWNTPKPGIVHAIESVGMDTVWISINGTLFEVQFF